MDMDMDMNMDMDMDTGMDIMVHKVVALWPKCQMRSPSSLPLGK